MTSARSLSRVQRPAFALQRAHGFIAIDRHSQRVTEAACRLEITNMSDVEQIKAAIRQNKLPACAAHFSRDGASWSGFDNFFPHGFGDNEVEGARQDFKTGRFVADQLAVDIEPHSRFRIHG